MIRKRRVYRFKGKEVVKRIVFPGMDTIILWITCLIILGGAGLLPAQTTNDLEWTYFGPEQGMGMAFHDILQDHRGFIWFGTSNGLYRYDGYQIRSFKKYTNRPAGLLSDYIWDLEEDADGNIWLATYDGGIGRWDRVSGKFTHYRHRPGMTTGLSSNNILDILIDGAGDIWAVVKTPKGVPALDKLVVATGEVKHYRYDVDDAYSLSCDTISINAFPVMQFNPLYLDANGGVWVATLHGLNRYDRETDSFRRFLHEKGNPRSLPFDRVLSVDAFEKEGQTLWVRTASTDLQNVALARLDLTTNVVERIDLTAQEGDAPNPFGLHLSEDETECWISGADLRQFKMSGPPLEQQRIEWGSTEGRVSHLHGLVTHSSGSMLLPVLGVNPLQVVRGADNAIRYHHLFYYKSENGQITSIEQHPTEPNQPLREIYSVMEDRSGTWWLGSMGFYKLAVPSRRSNNKPRFENYKWVPNDPEGLSSTDIRAVFEASPSVFWLATNDGGLNRLDRSTGAIQHWRHDPLAAGSLGSDQLYALWYNPLTGELWIGHETGIDILDLKQADPGPSSTLTFRHFLHPSGLLNDRINELQPDGKGNLWIGTSTHGLLLLDLETEQIRDSILFDENSTDPAHSAFINKVYIDSTGQTWVAPGMGGLCRLREAANGFRHDCFLDGLFIVDFLEASDGLLWCAAMNYGIIKFNPEDASYEIVNMENRLSRNSVMGIEEDKLGRIWFTSIGLTRFDPKENTYKIYGRESGVLELDPERCFFKSRSGELFYSAPNSALQIFTPEEVLDNPVAPQVVLTDFKLFNESVAVGKEGPLRENIEVASTIYLTYDQHSFSFEFVGLEYSDPLKNQYRFQLEGVDRDWVYAGTNREARYNSVSPGKYTFRVAAANSDGVWSTEPVSVKIIIAYPWWRRWWAYPLFAGLLLTPILLIYRYQVKRKMTLAETHRLREIDALKTRLYTNITHEFRTPLTVILGMAGQVVRQPDRWFREGMDMIVRNAHNLLDLVNQMLDLRKIEAGEMKLNRQLADVIPYLTYLTESFHSFAEAKGLDLRFSTSVEECLMDHDPDSLQKILTNLLSNAIKYNRPGGQIIVTVAHKNENGAEWLEIEVNDTGIGITPEQQEKVFHRFHQADDQVTIKRETTWMNIRPEGGTGIGLALTQELVRLLGGTISLRSQLGEGSAFCVQLPISRSAARREAFRREKVNGVSSYRSMAAKEERLENRILSKEGDDERPLALVIEDNKDVVRYLYSCLEQDYRLMAAYDGQSGIDLAREHVPDIIISDVMMPEKDGFEVTATLKKDERTSHIPIILLTARATQEDRLDGLSRGADAYLAKPFNRDELMIRMEKMIELRDQLRKRYAGVTPGPVSENPNLKLEDDFVQKVRRVTMEHLDDLDFSVQALSDAIFLSPTQVHRKLKALTGHPPGHFIRTVRLQRALHLLKATEKSITEISQEVGFRDLAYFSRVFTAEFGKPPSEMRE